MRTDSGGYVVQGKGRKKKYHFSGRTTKRGEGEAGPLRTILQSCKIMLSVGKVVVVGLLQYLANDILVLHQLFISMNLLKFALTPCCPLNNLS